jgi:phosphate transport system substrate-binding protein
MTFSPVRILAAMLMLCGAAAASGCAEPARSGSVSGAVVAVGTRTQENPIDVWSKGWRKDNPNTSFLYSADGETIGMRALAEGQSYLSAGDRPVTAEESKRTTGVCGPRGAFSVPTAVLPIAIAYNAPGVKDLVLDASALSGIFTGRITHWDDPAILSLNPGHLFPHMAVIPVTASRTSGYTGAAMGFMGIKHDPDNPTWPDGTPGETVRDPSELAGKLDSTGGGIAVIDRRSVFGRFSTASIATPAGVAPLSDESLQAAVSAAAVSTEEGTGTVRLSLANTAAGYPLVTVGYQTMCHEYGNEALASLIRAWGSYVVGPGQDQTAYFARLPILSKSAREAALHAIESIETSHK